MSYLYRIQWMTTNGYTGHGEYCLSLQEGNAWIDSLSKEYPDVRHWLERYPIG